MRRRAELCDIPARFWAKVAIGEPHECWPCQGVRNRGYGMFWLRDGLIPGAPRNPGRKVGRMHAATRVAWYLSYFGWPDLGKDVCHTCDNPPCCNPDHLWLGTTAENMADMSRKGRASRVGAPGGERHPDHKLTDAQVREVLRLVASGLSQSEVGAMFGVSQSLVSAYVRGIRRKDVTAA